MLLTFVLDNSDHPRFNKPKTPNNLSFSHYSQRISQEATLHWILLFVPR